MPKKHLFYSILPLALIGIFLTSQAVKASNDASYLAVYKSYVPEHLATTPNSVDVSTDASYIQNDTASAILTDALLHNRDTMRESNVKALTDSQVQDLAYQLLNNRVAYGQSRRGKTRLSTAEVANGDDNRLILFRFIPDNGNSPASPYLYSYTVDKPLYVGKSEDANLQLRDILKSYAGGTDIVGRL